MFKINREHRNENEICKCCKKKYIKICTRRRRRTRVVNTLSKRANKSIKMEGKTDSKELKEIEKKN